MKTLNSTLLPSPLLSMNFVLLEVVVKETFYSTKVMFIRKRKACHFKMIL